MLPDDPGIFTDDIRKEQIFLNAYADARDVMCFNGNGCGYIVYGVCAQRGMRCVKWLVMQLSIC